MTSAAESIYDVQDRAFSGLLEIVRQTKNVETICIISHYFPMRALTLALTGVDRREIGNLAILRLERTGDDQLFQIRED